MSLSKLSLTAVALAAVPILIGAQQALAVPIVFSATGFNSSGIQGTVDTFRDALGGTVPGPGGSFSGLRREINFDGVPNGQASPNLLPGNFFNVNSPRGVVFTTPGSGLQVSANSGSGTPIEFGNINPAYPSQFRAFSPERLFSTVDSNVVDVGFFVPGSTTPALTRGFGAVFTDVDLAGVTSLTFYDATNALLGSFFVPNGPAPTETLSFLGVDFGSALVSRVRITSGNTALGPSEGPGVDVVALDDFIYGEPRRTTAVPEPGSMALLALGALGIGLAARRRGAGA